MASAAAAIFQHQMTAGGALSPMDSSSSTSGSNGTSGTTNGTSGSNGSDSSSATISANDFLTLLVTEMQNQDPTADTDPNEYINQLVQVNSLEQLIDINQTLSSDLSTPSSSSSDGAATQVASATASGVQSAAGADSASAAAAAHPAAVAARLRTLGTPAASGQNPDTPPSAMRAAAGGNLSVPSPSAAARRVGHALDGRVKTPISTSPGAQ